MLTYVHHVQYIVRNLNDAIAYFDKSFLMKPDVVEECKGGRGTEALYFLGQTQLQLHEPGAGHKEQVEFLEKHGPGVDHVGWGVENMEKAMRDLTAKGSTFARGNKPVISEWDYSMAGLVDAETYLGSSHIQLAEDRKQASGTRTGRNSTPMFKYVQHVNYVVESRDKAVAYLEKAFGLKPYKSLESKGYASQALFRIGQSEIQITQPLGDVSLKKFLANNGPRIHDVAWAVHSIREVSKQFANRGSKATIGADGSIIMDQKDALDIDHLQLVEG